MTDLNVLQTLLVGHIWQSVALAALLAGVLIFGRRMPGASRYALSGAAFLAAIALPLAAFIPGESLVRTVMNQINAPAEQLVLTPAAPEQGTSALAREVADNAIASWATNYAARAVKGRPRYAAEGRSARAARLTLVLTVSRVRAREPRASRGGPCDCGPSGARSSDRRRTKC